MNALTRSPSPSPARGRGDEGAAGAGDWICLLKSEVQTSSAAAVARKLGVSRTAVSLCLLGKYPGGTQRMAARVLALLGERFCPLFNRCISAGACQNQCRQAAPLHNPQKMRSWGICQQCARNAQKPGFNANGLNG